MADVRAVALSLPETTERPSYGTPGFRVRDKLFARVLPGDQSIVVRCDFDQRDVLVESAPDIFEVTPHYQNYPAVVVHLGKLTRGMLEEVLEDAWTRQAPERLVKQRTLKKRN